MNTNPEPSYFGVIRSIFQIAGAYLIGHVVWGFNVTADWWQVALGVALSIASFVWSVKAKIATIEMTQGVLRELMSFLFGILGTFGWVTDQQAIAYMGLAAAFLPTIYSYFSRMKTKQLNTGEVKVNQLKQ